MKILFKNMLIKGLSALLFSTLLLSCSNNQKFKTVTIGDQVWMAENLNVDKFSNGEPIPHAQTNEQWQQARINEQPAWCYYDNDPANGKIYGKLYNWYAVNDWRGLAPEGWRIPSNEDWGKLIKLLGGKDLAGGKLKTKGTTYWLSPNTGANNETGFSALPGGDRTDDGTFYRIGEFVSIGCFGLWWTSTEYDTLNAWHRYMSWDYGDVGEIYEGKGYGFSMRCLRE